jgi:Ca2+-binding EF-hand superfamily protein
MDGISARNLLFGLQQAKSIEHKLNRFSSKKDTNGNNALSIKELGVSKDVFGRIDKNGDAQADKFELIIAAHNRAHAANVKTNQLINKNDANGDCALDAGKSGVPVNFFDRIDKNGDGKVDKVELTTADHNRAHAVDEKLNHLISKKDTNGNGVLDIGEFGIPKEVLAL